MSDYELELEVYSLRRAVITLEQKVAILEAIVKALSQKMSENLVTQK